MKLDKLFENAHRMEAPDSLKERVMAEIETSEEPAKAGFMEFIEPYVNLRRMSYAFATAAVLVLAIKLVPAPEPEVVMTEPYVSAGQVNAILDEAVNAVYGGEETFTTTTPAANGQEDDEVFIENQLNEIYLLNGGNSNA